MMGRNLADWNRGMGDAESGRLAASGRSQDYYDGYSYACAVDYEFIGELPEVTGESDLSQLVGDSAEGAAAEFTLQLDRLNTRLLESQSTVEPTEAGADADGARAARGEVPVRRTGRQTTRPG